MTQSKGQQLVHGVKQKSYGDPNVSFGKIAAAWSALLGVTVSKQQVALMMIMLKVIRENNRHKDDNLDDIDGYVECVRLLNA